MSWWTAIVLTKFGSASDTLAFVPSMLWNVSRGFSKVKFFPSITSAFFSLQPLSSCVWLGLPSTGTCGCRCGVWNGVVRSTFLGLLFLLKLEIQISLPVLLSFSLLHFHLGWSISSFGGMSCEFIAGRQGGSTRTHCCLRGNWLRDVQWPITYRLWKKWCD